MGGGELLSLPLFFLSLGGVEVESGALSVCLSGISGGLRLQQAIGEGVGGGGVQLLKIAATDSPRDIGIQGTRL